MKALNCISKKGIDIAFGFADAIQLTIILRASEIVMVAE